MRYSALYNRIVHQHRALWSRPELSMKTLLAARSRLYAYTRPTFALAGAATAASFYNFAPPQIPPSDRCISQRHPEDRLAALPAFAVGIAGVAAIVGRRQLALRPGGLHWLAHGYEAWAWGIAYGGLALMATPALLGISLPEGDDTVLLAPSAGAMLAAISGERLGAVAGRALLPALTGFGVLCACASTMGGDARGTRGAHALQATALVLLPALQLSCLPVYTLSLQGALACAWWYLAAGTTSLDTPPPLAPSPEAARDVLLAIGAASLLRTLITRVPVCQF